MKAWINGDMVDWEKATVPILSHSFSRGSAVFEVLDIVKADRGAAYFGLNEHLDRFYNSAGEVFMTLPLTRCELTDALISTARENNIREGLCKFFAYYSLPELTIIPLNPRVDIAVFCTDFASLGLDPKEMSAPVSVALSPYRKPDPSSIPVHAKVTGNYVNAFLAQVEASRRGFGAALLLDPKGYIAEGAYSNIFFVKGGAVITPTLRNILSGITRMAVIEVCRAAGMAVEERDISPDEIPSFDEAFYSGSVSVIEPVKSIEKTVFTGPLPGPVTCSVKEEMLKLRRGGIDGMEHWLTFI